MSDEDRFFSKVRYSHGCWEWTGSKRVNYGRFCVNGKEMVAHRFFYEKIAGKVPEGMQLDHLCRNRICVNPMHLEVVSARENTLRSTAVTAINASKTHCKKGHEFTPENTYIVTGYAHPRRQCRECNRVHCWEIRQKRKALRDYDAKHSK